MLTVLLPQRGSPVAAPIVDTPSVELAPVLAPLLAIETKARYPRTIEAAVTEGSIDATSQPDPTSGWFDERELKLSALGDDKSEMFVDPGACVYPDSFLRNLAGGRDDCGFLKPGTDESEVLGVPFLALSGWVLVIGAVAALYHFHRNWRLRRWLRRMQAQGLASRVTNPRRPAQHRVPRSSQHGGTGSRRYAGSAD